MSEQGGAKKSVEAALAVVFDRAHQHVLVCKRKDDTVLPGYWEFPGGKCDPGEAPDVCALREVREEVGIEVRAVRKLAVIEHEYSHAHVRLHPFVCEYVAGEAQLLAVAEARWVLPGEVLSYRFPEANGALVRGVAEGWGKLVS